MVVTVNLMMKSGAALTVWHETNATSPPDILREIYPNITLGENNYWAYLYRNPDKKNGMTAVLLNEVAVIEVFGPE